MNRYYYIFTLLFFVVTACNNQNIQSHKVPSVVLNTLKAKYPVIQDVDWEKHNKFYEVEFDLNDSIEVTVRIDEAGKLVMQKQDIHVNELLATIIQTIQDKYNGYSIDDAERIEKDGLVYYQVELDGKGKKDLNLVFSAEGDNENNVSCWD